MFLSSSMLKVLACHWYLSPNMLSGYCNMVLHLSHASTSQQGRTFLKKLKVKKILKSLRIGKHGSFPTQIGKKYEFGKYKN